MKRFWMLLLAGCWGLAPLALHAGECAPAVIAVQRAVLPVQVVPRLAVRRAFVRNAARQKVVVVQSKLLQADAGLAVVPFAVPVAVPVAVVQQPAVFYAYPAQAYPAYADARHSGAPAAGSAALPRSAAPLVQPPPAGQLGAVARACAVCHAGAEPPGGLDLADTTALSPAQRLEAIGRVLSSDPGRRMPKGAALSPAEASQVLGELAGELPPAGAAGRGGAQEGRE